MIQRCHDSISTAPGIIGQVLTFTNFIMTGVPLRKGM